MESVEDIRRNFTENFKAAEYHDCTHQHLRVVRPFYQLAFAFINDVVKSRRFKGTKLLELGSGPAVHNVASASAHFKTIVMSDLVEDNRDALKAWLKGDSPLDWSEFLDEVVALDTYKGDLVAARRALESRIRQNVKHVIPCDVASDPVIRSEDLPSNALPPYDLIISILCLEVAVTDTDGYIKLFRRVGDLLRKGGGLVICSYGGVRRWKVRGKPFHSFDISLKGTLEALDKAGFGNHDYKFLSPIKNDLFHQHDGFYYIASEKL